MKRTIRLMFLTVCVLLIGGCTMAQTEEENRPKVCRIASEKALKEDGSVLYTIEYEYDSNGEEQNRISYDGTGKEDAKWLEYAYDRQELLKEYWSVEAEGTATGYFKVHGDYEFVYDSQGNLVTWWFYDDNEMGIAKITYGYNYIEISEEE